MLGDWSAVDRDLCAAHLRSCQTWDGGFSLSPGAEGHGGATYTALASAVLLGRPDAVPAPARLLAWAIRLQGAGYRGRLGKARDSCYSFWVGATVRLLGAARLLTPGANREFVLRCVDARGGFGRDPLAQAEILHTFYGTAGLALMQEEEEEEREGSGEAVDKGEERKEREGACAAEQKQRDFEPLHWSLGISRRAAGDVDAPEGFSQPVV